MHQHLLRPAVAMIELIFAIVVMGLALLSAPMLIATAAESTTVALQQEGINEAAAKLNMILTYDWDEANANASCKDNPSILRVTHGDTKLDPNPTTHRRAGTPSNSLGHTYLCDGSALANILTATPIGKEGTRMDDIDDFDGEGSGLSVVTGNGDGGVDNLETTTVQIATSVNYIDDNASYDHKSFSFAPDFGSSSKNQSTNIKAITVTLTSSSNAQELSKTITLRAFSSNLGSYYYHNRMMP